MVLSLWHARPLRENGRGDTSRAFIDDPRTASRYCRSSSTSVESIAVWFNLLSLCVPAFIFIHNRFVFYD